MPNGFTMAAGEVTVVVEVCARLTGFGALANLAIGDVYRLHVLPARSPGQGGGGLASPPSYAALGEGGSRGPFGTAPTLAAAFSSHPRSPSNLPAAERARAAA